MPKKLKKFGTVLKSYKRGNEKIQIPIIQLRIFLCINFTGSESVALKVAEFVVRAFQTANRPRQTPTRRHPQTPDDAYVDESSQSEEIHENKPNADDYEVPSPMTPLKHLVRLFGLQPNQISAVAVNALVFVAQMVRFDALF